RRHTRSKRDWSSDVCSSDLDGVWAVTCFVTRAGFRRRGVATALARAAAGHARRAGAHAIEAYPITTSAAISEEWHVGMVGMFEHAGLGQVSAPTSRRGVLRLDSGAECGVASAVLRHQRA